MRILLVEDELALARNLKTNLESECFVVDLATDGDQGLRLALVNEYDLIILDNVLPKKDGQEVCRQVRLKKQSPPILMLSVIADPAKKVELLDAGADDYLTKPFSFGELMARIRALLRRPATIAEDVIRIKNISLDARRHLVKKDGEEIRLTKKEFMLLEYLMRHQGLVLSRGMILEHVWDMNADPFSNTIESHILSLRKKIEIKNRPLIHTIPGRGYKLEAT
ncbi:MAG TPA: response regulator transcription factor [Patescibacteria group bacterium]|nr:response regulator transcription factor [Patescibacteria group bacterium]